ncbi:hypothetical protein H0I76_11685 [Limibaculum sp. M0105]|uniref:Hpr(Ser) kinase/phosphatase n=2 Tax=Thermohalobaculum xanthum TaxID=2753746 RepID=A0A8J7SEJ5_9RHOB|nr:hypothetical protein [Thermohalobaculum xanthum]
MFRSEFEIPEMRSCGKETAPDIEIVIDRTVREAVERAARHAAVAPEVPVVLAAPPGESGAGFFVPEVAGFWVTDGTMIRVAPEPGADAGMITLYTLGTAVGLALFQRGAFVMHGASVAHRGQATLIVGQSGAGKSTLAARLGLAGCPILGDDTIALWPAEGGGRFLIHPAGTSFKLWGDALEAAGLATAARGAVARRVDKFYLDNPHQAEDRAYELSEVLVLKRGASGEPPRIEPLPLLEAVRAVTENVYRPQFAEVYGMQAEQFRRAAALASDIPVARLIRPWDHAATESVVDLLRAHLEIAGRGTGGGMAEKGMPARRGIA